MIKINEIFQSIQGEGKYAGYPVLFIRLSGCNKSCDFCDTSYHKEGKEMTVEQLIKRIKSSKLKYVVWTGGEPTLQFEDMKTCIINTPKKIHHLETNGTGNITYEYFQYVCCSPKEMSDVVTFKKTFMQNHGSKCDIKVVTDLELNKDLLEHATMLMPLTVLDKKVSEMFGYATVIDTLEEINEKIVRNVWNYCVNNNIKFCLRQHIIVWGGIQRGV